MANHWVFNTAYALENIGASGRTAQIGISSLESGLGFAKNDPYLRMDRVHGQYTFIDHGKIIGVDSPELLPLTAEDEEHNRRQSAIGGIRRRNKFLHKIWIETDQYIAEHGALDDIAFSLVAVHRYNNPERQFQKQFRTLSEKDFETIIKGWIYIARTAFGKIANALPRENKLEFTLLAMDKFQTIDFKGINFIDALEFLFEYVHKNFINQGMLLVATSEILHKNFSDTLDIDQVSLLETGATVANKITNQAELFRHLIEIDQKSDFIAQIKSGIAENGFIEKRFQVLFKGTTWPIDLSK